MIDINFNNKYNSVDATIEILVMLFVALMFGFLLSYFISKSKTNKKPDIEKTSNDELKLIKKALENCMNEKSEIKKIVTLEYSEIIDDYKSKLQSARLDLEKCLSDKAELKK